MKIIFEKKNNVQKIHSLNDLRKIMEESNCCLFFLRDCESVYSLFLDTETGIITYRSHRGNEGELLLDDNIGDFEYFKLDDHEFSAILDED